MYPQRGWIRNNDDEHTITSVVLKDFAFYLDSEPFDNHFYYKSIIGKVNYWIMLTCHDKQFAVYSCASFSTCPEEEHGDAVEYLTKY